MTPTSAKRREENNKKALPPRPQQEVPNGKDYFVGMALTGLPHLIWPLWKELRPENPPPRS